MKGKEIERKFLLRESDKEHCSIELLRFFGSFEEIKRQAENNSEIIRQCYLGNEEFRELSKLLNLSYSFTPTEFRVRSRGNKTFLTLKDNGGLERNEYEVPISPELFKKYWSNNSLEKVEKRRLSVLYSGHILEIDFYSFWDLVVAEIEFDSIKEAEGFKAIGKEITSEVEYKNKNLARVLSYSGD